MAQAAPMPLVPPVTNAVLPVKEKSWGDGTDGVSSDVASDIFELLAGVSLSLVAATSPVLEGGRKRNGPRVGRAEAD